MQKLKRNINMGFRVTPDEQSQIRKRMEEIGFSSVRAYLMKMAIDGMVVNIDMADVRECSRLLRTVSNNVNQLARHSNEGGSVSASDIAGIQDQLGGIWGQQEMIIKSLTKMLEAS